MDVLFAIVSFAVRANFAMSGTEASSLAPGGLANETIAAFYLRPGIVSNGLQRNLGTVCKISLAILLLISMALTIVSLITGAMQLLMVGTLLLPMLLAPIVFATAAVSLATTAHSKFAMVSPASKYTPMRR
jgi:hypothetical protein